MATIGDAYYVGAIMKGACINGRCQWKDWLPSRAQSERACCQRAFRLSLRMVTTKRSSPNTFRRLPPNGWCGAWRAWAGMAILTSCQIERLGLQPARRFYISPLTSPSTGGRLAERSKNGGRTLAVFVAAIHACSWRHPAVSPDQF